MMEMKKILLLVITVVVIGTILGVTFLLGHEQDKKGQIMQSKENNITTTDRGLSIVVTYNNNRYDKRLATAWGFSCLIRGTEKTILFDAGGDGSILLANMGKLGINPKEIDLVVLSHIHSDHVGGLHSILEKNPKVVVYLPESFPMSFKSNVIEYGAKVVEVHEPLKICDSVYSLLYW
jgi:7,8-dihydropterin-6-yl-methyl-4-(beta-D-ribofuranosyl)aminobenzene 5'-phosphate synthase